MGSEGNKKKLTIKDCLIFLTGCIAGVMSAMTVIAATEPAPSYGNLDAADESDEPAAIEPNEGEKSAQ